jgi:hypothetical protein
MLSAFRQPNEIQSVLAYAILSPEAEGPLEVIYRGHALYTAGLRSALNGPITACLARGYRLHTRVRSAATTTDLLLEPWLPMAADSLCDIPRLNELFIPHDPEVWMPPFTMAPAAPIPGDWMIARWNGESFESLRYVKDVKLE